MERKRKMGKSARARMTEAPPPKSLQNGERRRKWEGNDSIKQGIQKKLSRKNREMSREK